MIVISKCWCFQGPPFVISFIYINMSILGVWYLLWVISFFNLQCGGAALYYTKFVFSFSFQKLRILLIAFKFSLPNCSGTIVYWKNCWYTLMNKEPLSGSVGLQSYVNLWTSPIPFQSLVMTINNIWIWTCVLIFVTAGQ